MKKYLIFFSLMIYVFAACAQIDKQASDLLKKVSLKYKSYASLKTDYSIKIHFADAKTDIIKKGTLYLKGAKFKMQIDEVISTCDGKNIWNYLPNEKQVQVSLYDKTDGSISPEKFFTFWEKDYIYRVKENKVLNGKNTSVIEMSPTTKKNASIFKIDVTINTSNNELMSFLIYEKNGTRTTYTMNATTANPALSDAFFIFDTKAYPGVEVVDLR